jgi:hypothetical protein
VGAEHNVKPPMAPFAFAGEDDTALADADVMLKDHHMLQQCVWLQWLELS